MCSIKCYKLSIYRGYVWHDSAHSMTITMINPEAVIFERMNDTPHISPYRATHGEFRNVYKDKLPQYIESAL